MVVRSVSFDDSSEDDLFVFSGSDLLISHYDHADLDWQEVAERTALDERRGLMILQVAVMEDLIDEFILYLGDEPDQEAQKRRLERTTIGPRLVQLEDLLQNASLFDSQAEGLFITLQHVVDRRNELAHGVIEVRPEPGTSWSPGASDVELEWVLTDRRTRTTRRITMSELRADIYEAAGAFSGMLEYAEHFVEVAPWPVHFRSGVYLSPPTP